jgi:hypothetical protein
MTFKVFRDRAQWVVLGLAMTLFVLDWFTRSHHVAFVDGVDVETTPRIVIQVWRLLLFSTLLAGLVTLPRLPSLLALLSFVWVIFLSIQGH